MVSGGAAIPGSRYSAPIALSAAEVTSIRWTVPVSFGFLRRSAASRMLAQGVLVCWLRPPVTVAAVDLVVLTVSFVLVDQIGRHSCSRCCYSDDWVTSSKRYPADSSALMLASSENRYSSGTSAIPRIWRPNHW